MARYDYFLVDSYTVTDFFYFSSSDGTPTDGVPIINIETVALPLASLYTAFAFFGVVFSVICLLFNFIFRNKK